MTSVPWPWALACLAFAAAAVVGVVLAIHYRRRSGALTDSARELAEIHQAGARREAEADYEAAVAAGYAAVEAADAQVEREVASAGSLADHLRDLDAGAE